MHNMNFHLGNDSADDHVQKDWRFQKTDVASSFVCHIYCTSHKIGACCVTKDLQDHLGIYLGWVDSGIFSFFQHVLNFHTRQCVKETFLIILKPYICFVH